MVMMVKGIEVRKRGLIGMALVFVCLYLTNIFTIRFLCYNYLYKYIMEVVVNMSKVYAIIGPTLRQNCHYF